MSNQPSKPPAILRNPFPFASGVTRFEIKNLEQAWYSDLYHYLLAISWRRLLVVYFLIYLGTNALFGLLFWLGGDVRHNVRFVDMIDTKSSPRCDQHRPRAFERSGSAPCVRAGDAGNGGVGRRFGSERRIHGLVSGSVRA